MSRRVGTVGMLEGKVALVTGGARGQGRSHALTCAREGAHVAIVDIVEQVTAAPYPTATRADLDSTLAQIEELGARGLALEADVRSQQQLDDAVAVVLAELGGVDILIANAGIWGHGALWELTDEAWNDVLSINLTGVWHAVKAVVPVMKEQHSGSIVITSSVNGLEPAKDFSHYIASKHAVIGLMKSAALELAEFGIRCNAISPGAILTTMTSNQTEWDRFAGHPGGTEADMIQFGYHWSALRATGFLDPQVVADAALYLNSDMARAVTGVVLPVDGGHLLLPGTNDNPVLP